MTVPIVTRLGQLRDETASARQATMIREMIDEIIHVVNYHQTANDFVELMIGPPYKEDES